MKRERERVPNIYIYIYIKKTKGSHHSIKRNQCNHTKNKFEDIAASKLPSPGCTSFHADAIKFIHIRK
jgi:hypothetical protein